MPHYFCHAHPDTLSLETQVLEARPGRVVLAETPFYPGGGGQPADRGLLRHAGGAVAVAGLEQAEGRLWHLLAEEIEPAGNVEAVVEPGFRSTMRQLHTATHLLNALVFQAFDGALVTGVQMYPDGTARMDFDLPGADGERLRALEAPINEAIARDLPLAFDYVDAETAAATPGLIRSRSVAPPPTDDGLIRIVEIAGLDRQACGGTHLASTGACAPVRLLKIDNKGRHNRRIRIGLTGWPGVPA